jgi:putative ABC transport system permease protein
VALDLKPVPGGRRHSFRVAMRMARRDIRRHKGRSLLIILLIMLPVGGMTGAATLVQSMQETPAERVQYQLGRTQARFQPMNAVNSVMVQDPLMETIVASNSQDVDPDFTAADPKDVLPAGYTVLTESPIALTTEVRNADVSLDGKAVDALNPAFEGKFKLLAGRSPQSDAEALVSPGLLDRFGMKLGENLTTSAGTFTAVGMLRDFGASDRSEVLFLKPGQARGAAPARSSLPGAQEQYYLVGPEPVTWAQVRKANTVGVAVLSRSVALNPPPMDQRSVDGSRPQYEQSPPYAAYLTGAFIGALALLEVGLLAGAAFSVGAKRQIRELALLAASGAEAPTVRAVVTAAGVCLGTLAVAAGAAAGLTGAGGVVLWARHFGYTQLAGFHPDILLVAIAMLMGLGACILAALAPARQVSRQAVLGALKSGRAPVVAGIWPQRAGAFMLVVSAVLLFSGNALADVRDDPDLLSDRMPLVSSLVIAGAVLTVTGLVLVTGSVVSLMTRRTGRLPLPWRMAARDSARNRSRTVPAVAAVLAAATLASAAMVLAASQEVGMRENHQWQALRNQAMAPLTVYAPLLADGSSPVPVAVDPVKLSNALMSAVDTVSWTQVLNSPGLANCGMGPTADLSVPAVTPTSNCLLYSLKVPAGNECALTAGQRVKDPQDWRCQGSMRPFNSGSPRSLVVGGEAEIRAMLGTAPSEEALEVLKSGGMVVTNPVFVRDGRAVVEGADIRRDKVSTSQLHAGYEVVTSTELPAAVVVPQVPVPYFGVISPAGAESAGIRATESSLLVQLSASPSPAQHDLMTATASAFFGKTQVGMYAEPGVDRDSSWVIWTIVGLSALITLSAAGITTGLSLADSRSDHMTLAGVGAAPRLRKALAGVQALMTGGLGSFLGCLAGIGPAIIIVNATGLAAAAVVPWLQLLALLIAVPLTGSVLAWVFTRARLPMSRRGLGA